MAQPSWIQWQCCQCHGGPHQHATTLRCTCVVENHACQHDVCGNCKKDDDIPSPLGKPVGAVHARPSRIPSRLVTHDSHSMLNTIRHAAYHPRNCHGYGSLQTLALLIRPSTTCWRCHNCGFFNNAGLHPTCCGGRLHYSCLSCATLTS